MGRVILRFQGQSHIEQGHELLVDSVSHFSRHGTYECAKWYVLWIGEQYGGAIKSLSWYVKVLCVHKNIANIRVVCI
jgi:hypothetical protein